MPVFRNLSGKYIQIEWLDSLQDVLIENAGGTFLWASLVLKEREETPTNLVRKKSIEFPAELTSLHQATTVMLNGEIIMYIYLGT
jgi:hypothetical protein